MGMENIIVAHVKPWGLQRVYIFRQQAQKLNLMSPCIAFVELVVLMDWINVTANSNENQNSSCSTAYVT